MILLFIFEVIMMIARVMITFKNSDDENDHDSDCDGDGGNNCDCGRDRGHRS